MPQLTGKAKTAFLAKMAKGRAAASRRRTRQTRGERTRAPNTGTTATKAARRKPAGKRRASKHTSRSRSRRKGNPELLVIGNPARKGLANALRNYRKFHGQDPPAIWRLKKGGKGKPLVLIALGRAIEIIYEPVTGQRKRIQWFHEFGKDAILAVSEDRKRLFILSTAGDVLFDFSRGITG